MNIAMCTRVMPAHSIGGMQDHVQTLSAGLVARGHRVCVITTARADGIETERVDGVEIYYLPGTTPGRYSAAYWRASAQKFARLHAAHAFDILHSHSIAASGIYRADLPAQLRVPLVASLHGTHLDVLTTAWHTDFALTKPLGAARFFAIAAQMFLNYAARDRAFIRGAQCLIATSDADPAKYQLLYRVPAARIRTVYNGIDARLFAPAQVNAEARRALALEPDTKIILALARLQKDKGVQNAIAMLPRVLEKFRVALVIVGDGDYRAALEMQARQLSLTAHVRFVGARTLNECARYFQACDIFVDPTLRTDGYDLTIAEAMACEKLVIASDVGANSTLVDATTGILIPRGDNAALARETLRALENPNAAAEMGKRARQKILARFSTDAMVEGMTRVYEELKNDRIIA
ncbi:MAG: glycosyltransferase family 4 protein [Chloroflexi bacterium]|nr:glycosyltransferase family 4 protein [Chloroflexota bacterium]